MLGIVLSILNVFWFLFCIKLISDVRGDVEEVTDAFIGLTQMCDSRLKRIEEEITAHEDDGR